MNLESYALQRKILRKECSHLTETVFQQHCATIIHPWIKTRPSENAFDESDCLSNAWDVICLYDLIRSTSNRPVRPFFCSCQTGEGASPASASQRAFIPALPIYIFYGTLSAADIIKRCIRVGLHVQQRAAATAAAVFHLWDTVFPVVVLISFTPYHVIRIAWSLPVQQSSSSKCVENERWKVIAFGGEFHRPVPYVCFFPPPSGFKYNKYT